MKKFKIILIPLALALCTVPVAAQNVKLETTTQTGDYKLYESGTPSLSIDFSLEFASSANDPAIFKNINNAIIKHIFGNQTQAPMPKMLENFAASVVKEYRQENADAIRSKSSDSSLNWRRTGKARFTTTYGYYRSYEIDVTTEDGGIRPIVSKIGTVFNMKTGKEMGVDEFLLPAYDEVLGPVLNKHKYDGNNAGVKYNTDKLISTDNFKVSSKGITFIYNPYEVASPSAGVIEILVPWSDLKTIINK